MSQLLQLGDLQLEVIFKDIKNVHLSVHPPLGRVRLAAPKRMSLDRIRLFAISKLDWIKKQQRKLQEQDRELPREYLERESHYVWGKRYLLTISERDEPPQLELRHNKILLTIRPGTPEAKRATIVDSWYRELVKAAVPSLIKKWEPLLKVNVQRFFVQRMKTRWGSCNHRTGSIRLNTDLAKKPRDCLEYLVVHEMTHLIEPTHNERFVRIMDSFMPTWRNCRAALNRLPVRHESWEY